MAKKCLGIREDTGDQCQRSASRDSDFCFMHQSQEGNQKVQHVDDDVYYCPHDGNKLLYDVKRDYHRCKKCRGSLFSGKMISSDYARKINPPNTVDVCDIVKEKKLPYSDNTFNFVFSKSLSLGNFQK